MEPLLIFLGLALLAAILLGPIFGFVAWLASRENRRRLIQIEERDVEIGRLRARVLALEEYLSDWYESRQSAPQQPTAPAQPLSEQPADPGIEDVRAAAPVPKSVTEPAPQEKAAVSGPPESAPEPAPKEPGRAEEPPTEAEPQEGSEPSSGPSVPPSSIPPDLVLESPYGAQEPPSGGGKIEWERWIGLRGAAVLGGAVLALAALLFLKYSIEAGLIPPIVRVALAFLTGVGALGGSLVLRKRGYATTANGLAGAGIVILYGAIWAARSLYGLIGSSLAYPLMILVTVVCGLYSWRFRTLVVAVLGLFGGFATPALLSSGSDNPLGLFSYLLLLNIGLLTLARKRGWPVLALLSVAVTGLYQAGWIFDRMRGDNAFLALAVLGVFAVLFAVGTARLPISGEGKGRGESLPTWLGGSGAVFVAFVCALQLSSRAGFETRILPLAALLALLAAAAQWLGRVHKVSWIPLAAVGLALAPIFNWLRLHGGDKGQEWQFVGAALLVAVAFHLALEWQARRSRREGSEGVELSTLWAPSLAAFGLLLLLGLPAWFGQLAVLGPWVLGWLALAGLLVRQSTFSKLEPAQALAAFGLGLGPFWLLAHNGRSALKVAFPSPWIFLGLALLACVGFQALGLRREGAGHRWANLGAAILPVLLLVGLMVTEPKTFRMPWVFLGGSLLLGFLVILAFTRLPSGKGYAAATALLALVHWNWSSLSYRLELSQSQRLLALGLQILAVLLFTLWPVLARRAFAKKRFAWYGAALAGPAWFFPLGSLYEDTFGDGTLGIVPLALGALSLTAAFRSRHLWSPEEPLRKSSLVWFAAVALGFVSLAIPLQLEKEWITVGWALQGAATLALWKRLDHPGLKYFSLALFGVVAVRLLANPEVLGYHPASGIPVVNWLTYTYLIPATCLLAGAYFLHRREVEWQRPWESMLYSKGYSVVAGLCGFTAILVVFAWINLSIADFFAVGSRLTLDFERAAARDLTTSLAWGIFAISLLAIGIARGWAALRWISLAFLVLTIGKVFLYDLGELEDLYRVASLVGLAISLILVSLVYQRFVFRREEPET